MKTSPYNNHYNTTSPESQLGTTSENNPMADFIFKYLPYWPIFLILFLVSLFSAWFYLRITPPVYKIQASVMVKDEKKGVTDGQTINALNQVSEKSTIENEVEVLQSRKIMSEVAKSLNLYVSYYEKQKFSKIEAYLSTPIRIEVAQPESINKLSKFEFKYSGTDKTVIINSNKYPLDSFSKTEYGLLKFTLNKDSQNIKEDGVFFATIIPLQSATFGLQSSFEASPSTKLTSVISLNLNNENTLLGERIVNEIIKTYNKVNLDEKNKLASATSDFVEDRLKIIEQELTDIEKKAQSYKSSRGAVDIGTQGQIFLQSVSATDQQLNDVDIQLSTLNEVEKYMRSKDEPESASGGITPSLIGIKDPTLPELLKKLSDQELSYEKIKATTGENNPVVTSIKSQISKLKTDVIDNVKNQRSNLQATKLNLNSANNTYSSILSSIPQKERELIDISRQQAIKSDQYAFLLKKKEESDLSYASNMSDIRIIDEASASPFPVSPKRMFIYILFVGAAMALPLLFLAIKELLATKILFRQEIEKLTNIPIIGEITYSKLNEKNPIVIQEGKRTFIAEQFRRIRSSLGFISSTVSKRKILVTSSLSGEGKSFVALNISLSIAMTDKKVVLLELDLANPSLGKKMNIEYAAGASDFLKGEASLKDVLQRGVIHQNLSYIPAGTLPENPSELLMRPTLNQLLDTLSDEFDVIIIDSAPSGLLSDAQVLSPLCDTTLYVIKHGYTPKKYVERLDQEKIEEQLQNIRIIFNGIKSRGFSKNGYGYGYGYGYVYNDKKMKKKKVYSGS